MKAFIFLLTLSLLLLVQVHLANAAHGKGPVKEDVTFADIVANVYAKTKKFSNNLSGLLGFMVNIRPVMTFIHEKFLVHPEVFMNKRTMDWMVMRVPESMKINGQKARSLVSTAFYAIYNAGSMNIPKLYAEIIEEISFSAPNKYDKEFDDSYKQWISITASETHAGIISKKLDTMEDEYIHFAHSFDVTLNRVNNVEASIRADFKLAKSKCENMALTNDSDDVKEVLTLLSTLSLKYMEFIQYLTNLRDILREYNRKRVIWAELLIGMRLDFSGEREPLLPGTSMVKQFVKIAKKNASSEKRAASTSKK